MNLTFDHTVVIVEQFPPVAIAGTGRPLGGLDDVGEQDRCQRSVGVGSSSRPGEELLDLAEHDIRVPDVGKVVAPREARRGERL